MIDKDILHLIIGIVAVIIALFLGKEWGSLKAWIAAHAQIVETEVKAAEAKAEALWSGDIARLKAAYELMKEDFEGKLAAVESRAAADLAKAKADADAALAQVKADAAAELAKAQAALSPDTAAPVVADSAQAPTAQA